ncbi:MAG TPA: hypothetical protein VFA45_05815 [Actinomycetes bacterium]|nr:hypothetical protein [Actinomycetes bacterium]
MEQVRGAGDPHEPPYTGYEVWNRQRRDEVLLDVVRDVAAGYTSKMRWNPPDQWLWSERPAHPPLVSRESRPSRSCWAL